MVQAKLSEIHPRGFERVWGLLDLGHDVHGVARQAAVPQRVTDTALRVVIGRGVDHVIAGCQRLRYRFSSVVPEVVGAQTQQRHAVATLQ